MSSSERSSAEPGMCPPRVASLLAGFDTGSSQRIIANAPGFRLTWPLDLGPERFCPSVWPRCCLFGNRAQRKRRRVRPAQAKSDVLGIMFADAVVALWNLRRPLISGRPLRSWMAAISRTSESPASPMYVQVEAHGRKAILTNPDPA